MTSAVVSVLIPARDEAAHIARCIDMVAAQDYPAELIEVIVVDGSSSDGTAGLAKEALASHGFRRSEVTVNPVGSTPSNLNVGLSLLRGDVVCRVDARSLIPPGYIRRCVEILSSRPDVAVVGGAQVAVAPSGEALPTGIARALNNRYAMGLSRYRRDAPSGPSDTVYLGSFRIHDLRRVGGWDVALPTNQDFDLNRRLSRQGLIWFEQGLDVGYVPRQDLGQLFRQYQRFGTWKVRYWRHTGNRPEPRQLVLLAAPPIASVIAAGLAVGSGRRARRMALVGLASAGALEVKGASRPVGSAAAHLVGVAAMATVSSGWLSGVYAELLRGRRP